MFASSKNMLDYLHKNGKTGFVLKPQIIPNLNIIKFYLEFLQELHVYEYAYLLSIKKQNCEQIIV